MSKPTKQFVSFDYGTHIDHDNRQLSADTKLLIIRQNFDDVSLSLSFRQPKISFRKMAFIRLLSQIRMLAQHASCFVVLCC